MLCYAMLCYARHTRYAGGYTELTPTIRDLWAVLGDFAKEDRA